MGKAAKQKTFVITTVSHLIKELKDAVCKNWSPIEFSGGGSTWSISFKNKLQ